MVISYELGSVEFARRKLLADTRSGCSISLARNRGAQSERRRSVAIRQLRYTRQFSNNPIPNTSEIRYSQVWLGGICEIVTL